MSVEKVRDYFKSFGYDDRIIEFDVSSATVEFAAKALGCDEMRIAKTLSFKVEEKAIVVVTAGDMKIDNRKFKDKFMVKAKMLTPDEVTELIGHSVGGVCPFAVNKDVGVYLDVSLKRFETVFPAAGSSNSAVELSCEELEKLSGNCEWVDLCKGKSE